MLTDNKFHISFDAHTQDLNVKVILVKVKFWFSYTEFRFSSNDLKSLNSLHITFVLGVGYKCNFLKNFELNFFGFLSIYLDVKRLFFLSQMRQKKVGAIFVILLIFLIKICEYSLMKVLSTLVVQTSFVKWVKFQHLAYNSQKIFLKHL